MYSLVDLMEVLLNKQNTEYQSAKEEFQKRNPSEKELEEARKGLDIRLKSKNKPLSFVDKIYCILSVFVDLNNSDTKEYEKQLDEYEMYGETKRVEEIKRLRKYAIITFLGLLVLLFLIALFFNMKRN